MLIRHYIQSFRQTGNIFKMSDNILEQIKGQINSNPVLIYMKGSPQMPQCGFSQRAVQALIQCGEPFAFVDILSHPEIRVKLPEYASWPTFPQLWLNGELIGGCDIITELFEKGELQPMIKQAIALTSKKTDDESTSSIN